MHDKAEPTAGNVKVILRVDATTLLAMAKLELNDRLPSSIEKASLEHCEKEKWGG
jgi:hypothetical protein